MTAFELVPAATPGGIVTGILVVVIVLAVGLLVIARFNDSFVAQPAAARQREADLGAWAAQHGWHYQPSRPDLAERFTGYPFDNGYGKRALNAVHGRYEERPFVAYDYHRFRPGDYENRWETDARGLGIGGTFAVIAIYAGSGMPDAEISHQGTVTPTDAAGGGLVLPPDLVGQLGYRSDLTVRSTGGSVLAIRERQRFTVEEIPTTLALLAAVRRELVQQDQ